MGILAAPDEQAPSSRRSRRDWIVDGGCVLIALVFGGLVFLADTAATDESPFASDGPSSAFVWVDFALGIVACAALWWRRRWPLGMALASVPFVAVSAMGGVAASIFLFTVAVHRRWPAAAAIGALHVAVSPIYWHLHEDDQVPRIVLLALAVILTSAVIAWGMYVRARRQLILSLRERATRVEAEQHLRVDQARHAERARIAREMHDVLAHRISLLSLHAGALEFRPDASPEHVARSASIIRASAHQALEDLREVIGVLREEPGARPPEPPQPTLADLPLVLEESRAAGMSVTADVRLDDLAGVPAATGRAALRIVQEGLTNARKHAAGSPVTVTVHGAPGDGLVVTLVNPSLVTTGPPDIPGSGTGLVGLAERAALAGGRLEHETTGSSEFRLRAWLPWT